MTGHKKRPICATPADAGQPERKGGSVPIDQETTGRKTVVTEHETIALDAPDDRAVEVWALWLRRSWNTPGMVLSRIQRYARLTLGPIQHFPGDQAHYGECTDPVWLDGSHVMGRA